VTQAKAVCARCGEAKPLSGSEFVKGKAVPLCADCHRAKNLATMIRMLASDKEGDRTSAADAFIRTLQNAGRDVVNNIAERIEHFGNGALSETEMQEIYDAGMEAGLRQQQHAPANGASQMPSGRDMAMYC